MKKVEVKINEHNLILETGLLAKQADGSILVKYKDSSVIVTAVMAKDTRQGIDFLPLSVEYREKTYAAGKIPGGFFKREGRPTEGEILTSRLIDRSIRPLFPKDMRNELQIIANVLSYDPDALTDVMSLTAASAALMISGIPFDGPVSAVRIGYLDGKYYINPSFDEKEKLQLEIVVAGRINSVAMIEGNGDSAPEDVVLQAIDLAGEEINKLCQAQLELKEMVNKPAIEYTPPEYNPEFEQKISAELGDKVNQVFDLTGKMEQQDKEHEILDSLLETLVPEDDPDADLKKKHVINYFYDRLKDEMRRRIFENGIRPDGRKPSEIRPIMVMAGLLPRAHGSALFQRGETQSLAAVTLGSAGDEQIIDNLDEETRKRFLLHYNFPPFSVGEVRPMRGPGRREIGHGALAERSLLPVIPGEEEFPYTIRIVSEILESNGSSSQATVCAGCLSLMDAGVPIKTPVAGIALGLIISEDKFEILSDIAGMEDHFGDMDFKVAGTEQGINTIQLDIKVQGLTREILSKGLEQARQGRLHILSKMKEVLPEPRKELSPFAPKIAVITIPQEKIGGVIGPGGKVIKEISAQTGSEIFINDDGIVKISGPNSKAVEEAVGIVEMIAKGLQVGQVYEGVVDRIEDYGAFLNFAPGVNALLHVSELEYKRTKNVRDVLNMGDTVKVKVTDIDNMGRVKVSRKALLEKPKKDHNDKNKDH